MAQQLHLPDGRIVQYLISGDPDGFPFVWIHGTPGAYQPVPGLTAVCKKKGVKVITLSRAGYGGSSRNRGRSVVDAVADLHALNEHLGVKQCFVGGWSGGGEQLTFPSCSSDISYQTAETDLEHRPACVGLCSAVTRLCRRAVSCQSRPV